MDDLNVILPELKRALKKRYGDRLVTLVLYGSHARNEATEDSDIDVMVVLDYLPTEKAGDELWDISEISAEMSYIFDTLLTLCPVGEDDYENRLSPLLINVRDEGKVFWPETKK